MLTPVVTLSALVLLNLWAFGLMAYDKYQATRGGRRVPEARLLFYAYVGGAIGAKLAQRLCRHKTRKQPFAWQLTLALGLNALMAGAVIYAVSPWST